MRHRELIDRIEDAANALRVALIEGDDAEALIHAHVINLAATDITRALYDDAAIARLCEVA